MWKLPTKPYKRQTRPSLWTRISYDIAQQTCGFLLGWNPICGHVTDSNVRLPVPDLANDASNHVPIGVKLDPAPSMTDFPGEAQLVAQDIHQVDVNALETY